LGVAIIESKWVKVPCLRLAATVMGKFKKRHFGHRQTREPTIRFDSS
jgi:hypothetical protein